MSTTKQIKALTGFHHVGDADVLNRGYQVETSLTGNSHFPNPPVDLATLKAALDTFAALTPQALEGSKKVIAEKKQATPDCDSYAEGGCQLRGDGVER